MINKSSPMNRPIFKRLIIEAVVLLICSIVLLFQLNWLSFPNRQSQADIVTISTVSTAPDDYAIGIFGSNKGGANDEQLYTNLNLKFTRFTNAYTLPTNRDNPLPKPSNSFPISDQDVKKISA